MRCTLRAQCLVIAQFASCYGLPINNVVLRLMLPEMIAALFVDGLISVLIVMCLDRLAEGTGMFAIKSLAKAFNQPLLGNIRTEHA